MLLMPRPNKKSSSKRSTTMLLLKYLLMTIGFGMFGSSAALLIYNLYELLQYRLKSPTPPAGDEPSADVERPRPPQIRWDAIRNLAILACLPTLLSLSIEVVPSSMGGVRV